MPVPSGDARRYVYAWLCSGLAHGLVLASAMLLVSTLTLAPHPDVFRWHIAMVAPPPAPQAELHPRESPAGTTSTRALPKIARVPEPRPRVTRRAAEDRVIEQRAGRVVELPSPVPVHRRAATATIETVRAIQPVREPPPTRMIVTRDPAPAAPAAEPLTGTRRAQVPETPSIERVTPPIRTPPPAVRQEAPASIVALESTPAEDVRLRGTPPARELSSAEEPRLVTPVRQPVVTATEAARRPAEKRIPEPVVRDVEPGPEESAARRALTTAPAEDPGSSGTEVAAKTREVPRPPARRPDFGWVAKAIWRQVAQLKHYPHVARLKRWEGTVLIRAVIRGDGSLADLEVERSSGHAILDEDAMALLRKASPLSLQHDLGRPQLTIRIPINYELE